MSDPRTVSGPWLASRPAPARSRALAGLIALIASCALATGCGRPLLAPDDERSPFDRYDALRNQSAPQTLEDPFGRKLPNLRGRLAPRND
ncbi:MAG: hypothetical protein K2X32_14155 [Phycisphaerales bacterium]|nr:hypothetical protein [Phycisphaerales bacterium]